MKTSRGGQVAGQVAGLTVEDATSFDEIINRLKMSSGTNSDAELSVAMGLKSSAVSTARGRGTVPPSWIINASNQFKVSADWLIYGDDLKGRNGTNGNVKQLDVNTIKSPRTVPSAEIGEYEHIEPAGEFLNDISARYERRGNTYRDTSTYGICGDKYTYVPIVDDRLSNDGDSLKYSEFPFPVDYLAFKSDWLIRLGRPKDFRLMEVKGDSMAPTLLDNDLIMFDISRFDYRPGRIYAVGYNGHIYLRRLYIEKGKEIYTADNEKHWKITVGDADGRNNDEIYLIGQVIWWCHTENVTISNQSIIDKL